jgi:hypothetical protein
MKFGLLAVLLVAGSMPAAAADRTQHLLAELADAPRAVQFS